MPPPWWKRNIKEKRLGNANKFVICANWPKPALHLQSADITIRRVRRIMHVECCMGLVLVREPRSFDVPLTHLLLRTVCSCHISHGQHPASSIQRTTEYNAERAGIERTCDCARACVRLMERTHTRWAWAGCVWRACAPNAPTAGETNSRFPMWRVRCGGELIRIWKTVSSFKAGSAR